MGIFVKPNLTGATSGRKEILWLQALDGGNLEGIANTKWYFSNNCYIGTGISIGICMEQSPYLDCCVLEIDGKNFDLVELQIVKA